MVLLRICLVFCQFQLDFAYKSVAYKKSVYYIWSYKDDRSFSKTVEKPPESPSMSGSIKTAGNDTSQCDLDPGDEELVNLLHDLHES